MCPPSRGGGRGEEGRGKIPPGSARYVGLCPFAFCVAHAKGQRELFPISLSSLFPFLCLPGGPEKTRTPPTAFLVRRRNWKPIKNKPQSILDRSDGLFIFLLDYKDNSYVLIHGFEMTPSFLQMPSNSSQFHVSISYRISLRRWGSLSRPSCW